MLRSDLIRRVVEATPGLREQDGQEVVSAVLETITIALNRGHRVEVRGLGSFRVKSTERGTGAIRKPVFMLRFLRSGQSCSGPVARSGGDWRALIE